MWAKGKRVSGTDDESTTLVVDIFVAKSGTNVRGVVKELLMGTYLVSHHCIMNLPGQTAEFIHILHVVEKTLNLPLLCNQFRQQNKPSSIL